jgi:hypothetical protein
MISNLLVHFGSRGNTIHGQEKQFSRLGKRKQMFQRCEYVWKDFRFSSGFEEQSNCLAEVDKNAWKSLERYSIEKAAGENQEHKKQR